LDDVSDPSVILIEFGDYECPFCRRVQPVLDEFLADNSDVSVRFRHYPLTDLHPSAEGAAKAAICAEAQGRFRQMHGLLLTESQWTETNDWIALADRSDVPDLDGFSTCMEGAQAEQRLQRDIALGDSLGVSGTPAFLVPGDLHRGYLTMDQLMALLESVR
jgi:protein-disulfide isomerase